MDGLLLALIACMAGEMGDRSQRLAAVLGERYRHGLAVAAGLILATAANSTISAYLGNMLVHMMGDSARLLFMALAFLAGGTTMWLPISQPDPLSGWRLGSFLTSFLGLFILGFGEGVQFLIAGITVARGDPVLTAIGGTLGICAACLPAMVAGSPLLDRLPLKLLRRSAACIFLLIGGGMAIRALGLG